MIHRKQPPFKYLDTDRLSYKHLSLDLQDTYEEQMDWIFEEFEYQFLNRLNEGNESDLEKLAINYAKHFIKLGQSEDHYSIEAATFALNLLYLQFPRVKRCVIAQKRQSRK